MQVRRIALAFGAVAVLFTGGCALLGGHEDAPGSSKADEFGYLIGPGDRLDVFVWRNPELTAHVTVGPDGKFSSPLVENLQASGLTTSQLAREIEKKLGEYIREPLVTITVAEFNGEYSEQIRVVGAAAKPQAVQYRKNMTVLDVMIVVGGLTEFAAGNRASIVRHTGTDRSQYRVYLDDLIKDGKIEANVEVAPGDILIIPEAWF